MAKAQAAAKTAAKSTTKGTKLTDPLADLGLAPTAKPAPAVVAGTDTISNSGSRTEVEVGDIEFGEVDFIPQSKRSSGGSKYKFDELKAPTKKPDGKTAYSSFTVRLQPGVDADALKRSVQSATTQANKHGKQQGKYFVTRALKADGDKAEGIMVIRTDIIPAKA